MIAFGAGTAVGINALLSRSLGEKNQAMADRAANTGIFLALCNFALFALIGIFFSRTFFELQAGGEQVIIDYGVDYASICLGCSIGIFSQFCFERLLQSTGRTFLAMCTQLTGALINIVLDPILIFGWFGLPRMEVAGASLATIIGQYCAMFMAFYAVMNGRQYLVLRFKDGFKPNKTEIGKIVDIGAPAMVEQLVMRAGMIIYTRTVAGLGTLAYAVHQVCMNIQSLSFMNGQAFAVSATSLSGQSLGRKRHDMAQAYISRTRKLGMCVSIFLGVIFFFFGGQIVALYSGGDQSLVDLGGKIMMFVALVQPFQSSQLILAGALRGAGDTKVTAVITFLTVLLVRPALAIFAINVLGMGLEGAWVALVIDQILRSLLVLLRYNSGAWKRHTM